MGFLTRDAMRRLFKLVLAPAFTMAQQDRSSTSHFKPIPGLRLNFLEATTLGSSVFSLQVQRVRFFVGSRQIRVRR